MNWFNSPKRVETGDVLMSLVALLLACFLVPTRVFEHQNMDWLTALVIVLPVTFVAGWFASGISPAFHIHAHWALISGTVVWPLCLLFRPLAADFAFTMIALGAGPVLAFHVERRIKRRR